MPEVRGPYFDELQVGQRFETAPGVTLTDGLAAQHRAILGNRLWLSLDRELSQAVTGEPGFLSPALVCDVSIGQSTVVTQRVKANLFYRGLRFHRFPRVDDTLRTTTEVVGLRENARREGRGATGLAALHIHTRDQADRTVLSYVRCAMLPLSPDAPPTGYADDLTGVGVSDAPLDDAAAVAGWDLAAFRERVPGTYLRDLEVGATWQVEGGDVVSSAPELARLTGNLAQVHHDARAAGGERLVYGGHTIGLAFHHLTQAVPSLVTVLAWEDCAHLAPVHEGELLRSRIELLSTEAWADGGVGVFRVVTAVAGPDGASTDVLDWKLVAALA